MGFHRRAAVSLVARQPDGGHLHTGVAEQHVWRRDFFSSRAGGGGERAGPGATGWAYRRRRRLVGRASWCWPSTWSAPSPRTTDLPRLPACLPPRAARAERGGALRAPACAAPPTPAAGCPTRTPSAAGRP